MTKIRQEDLDQIRRDFSDGLTNVKSVKDLESLRNKFLGRKSGALISLLKSLKNLSQEERKDIGSAANKLRGELEDFINKKFGELASVQRAFFDVSRPGKRISVGHCHILTSVRNEIEDIFARLNFSVVEGPEVETEYYNFDALNIPKNHPAREMWDTFWLKKRISADKNVNKCEYGGVNQRKSALLLRTHTSPMQIRYMEIHQPPIRIIVPGRVFRYEATDASHEVNFNQVEGLMVGKDISLANFRYVIETFLNLFFSHKVDIRFRPSYFPFVEPGLEIDIRQKGNSGKWLEVMGAGMVHPNVFKAVGYDLKATQGFAFGLGLERMAMIRYKIQDIRLFYSGDLRFINQF